MEEEVINKAVGECCWGCTWPMVFPELPIFSLPTKHMLQYPDVWRRANKGKKFTLRC